MQCISGVIRDRSRLEIHRKELCLLSDSNIKYTSSQTNNLLVAKSSINFVGRYSV